MIIFLLIFAVFMLLVFVLGGEGTSYGSNKFKNNTASRSSKLFDKNFFL